MSKKDRGVTLIELIVSLSILLIVLTLGYTVFFFTSSNYGRITEKSYLQQNARIIDEVMRNNLRNASSIVIDDEEPVEYDGYFVISSSNFISSGTELASEVVNDIVITKTEQVSSGGAVTRYLLSYTIVTSSDDIEFILENSILLSNISSSANIQMEIESSLKDYTLYFKSPD